MGNIRRDREHAYFPFLINDLGGSCFSNKRLTQRTGDLHVMETEIRGSAAAPPGNVNEVWAKEQDWN